jgi:hypothetical protein
MDDSAASLTYGSNFTDAQLRDNATVYENKSITIRTYLNGIPVGTGFTAAGDASYLSVQGVTGAGGRVEVWLASRVWNSSGLAGCDGYNVSITFRSWNETKAVHMDADTGVSFSFCDRSSPSISSVASKNDLLGGKEALTVTATVKDEGYGVTNVTLFYNIDGSGWKQGPMASLGGGTYAATFPMDAKAGRREALYYIAASDGAGNSAETTQRSHVTGQYTAPTVLVLAVLVVAAVAVAAVMMARRRRKRLKYLAKRESRVDTEGAEGNKDGNI